MTTLAFIGAALKSLPLILQIIQQFKAAADAKVQRGIGHDQAVAESLTEGARQLAIANEVEQEAARDHAVKKDDTAFDNDFIRKD